MDKLAKPKTFPSITYLCSGFHPLLSQNINILCFFSPYVKTPACPLICHPLSVPGKTRLHLFLSVVFFSAVRVRISLPSPALLKLLLLRSLWTC